MSERAIGVQESIAKGLLPALTVASLLFTACGGETSAIPAATSTTETSASPHLDSNVPADLITETNYDWEHDRIPTTFFIPASLTEEESTNIAEQTDGTVLNFSITSAMPAPDGTVTLPDTKDLWPLLQEGKTLSLFVGGEGESDEERAAISAGWQAALDNPAQFAENVTTAADAYNASTLDLYLADPEPEQRAALVGLIRAIRDRRPHRPITLAVPAFESAEELAASGFAMDDDGLPSVVDQFNVEVKPADDASGQPIDHGRIQNSMGLWIDAVEGARTVAPMYNVSMGSQAIGSLDEALRGSFPELGSAVFKGTNNGTSIQEYADAVSTSQ